MEVEAKRIRPDRRLSLQLVSAHADLAAQCCNNVLRGQRPLPLHDARRALERGEPRLTHGKPGVASFGHTLSTLAESPLKQGLLYTGSDDGLVHVSRNGGDTWVNISDTIPDVPAEPGSAG